MWALSPATLKAQGDEAFSTMPVVSYDLKATREASSAATDSIGRVSLAAIWREANSLWSARQILLQTEADSTLISYLNDSTKKPGNFRLPDERSGAGAGALALGRLQAGYGRLVAPDSVLTRGRNGTVWEDHSFIFVQTCFSF